MDSLSVAGDAMLQKHTLYIISLCSELCLSMPPIYYVTGYSVSKATDRPPERGGFRCIRRLYGSRQWLASPFVLGHAQFLLPLFHMEWRKPAGSDPSKQGGNRQPIPDLCGIGPSREK